jgi:uncharacterized protein (DUF488 family)
MPHFTAGYGGRKPEDFLALLSGAGVRTVVDVRLRPDRASMGAYVKAKSPAQGIEALLARAGIGYVSLVELGNVFLALDDWPERYAQLLAQSGPLLTARLADVPGPYCLVCAEKAVAGCHRRLLAEHLEARGAPPFRHLE